MSEDRSSAWPTRLAVAAILCATLFPTGDTGTARTVLCLVCGERGAADALLNILLFAPFGAALTVRRGAGFSPVLAGAALSLGIELLQIPLPGRDGSPGDVVFNTLGAALGLAVAGTAPTWLDPEPRLAGGLAVGAALVALLALAAGASLLAPQLPHAVYYGQWTAELGHLEWYRGHVARAAVGEIEVRSRRSRDSEALRARLLAGAPIRVEAVAGPPVPGLAPILSIYDEKRREIMLLGVDRRDAVFRYRTRAAALRLDQPDIRLADAFREVRAREPLRMAVRRDGRGYCIEVRDARACGLGFRVGDTWGVLLYPESLPGGLKRLLDLGWLAALFVPAGFWLRRRRAALGVGAMIAVGLAAIPPASTLLATPPSGFLAAFAGLAVGFGVHRARRWCSRATPPAAHDREGKQR